jgi:tyrosine-protein kinase Etk/Wzc
MIQAEPKSEVLSTTPASSEEGTIVLDALIVLARRKFFIASFTLGAAILTAIITLMLPVRYTASTALLPPSQSSSTSSILLSGLTGSLGSLGSLAGGSFGLKDPSDMYVALFRSRTVEDALIQRFGLMGEYHVKNMSAARKKFEDRSTVTAGVKDGLIRITVEDHDAKRAADLANGYVDEFRNNSANLAITEASRRRVFFEQELKGAKDSLTNAEVALEQTEQTTGVFQPGGQAAALIQSAAALRAQITAKQVEIQGLRSFATENNSQLVVAKQELAALQTQLAQLNGSGQDVGSDLILPKGKVPEAGMAYLRKLRDFEYYQTLDAFLEKQYEAAKLDEAREGPIVQVVDIAVPPDKKSFPKRAILVVLFTLLAFFFASLWALIANRWKEALQKPGHKLPILLSLLSLRR